MGMDDRDVRDATSQAQAALRAGDGEAGGLRAAPLVETSEAQVRLSQIGRTRERIRTSPS